ncbi:MAG: LysE family translocator [Alphaproteobacteria bacterium]|jgi:threonine/homoserine/homoserine lactone efflux protein|nr:LysE family translocator [Alphaproteobacteria bacterium]MDP6566986.1 LysE family translocator [Alphaproteobacteria bacterium]MDP6812165.1 LysE family translocator [Alphaproteobacteria bacterium]
MTESFLTFLAISVVVIVTPGQDTALTIRNTLVGGQRGGVLTAFGVATGQAVWALATAIGVVAFLVASEPVFAAVKLAGAGYIIFLGAQSLYAAVRPVRPVVDLQGQAVPSGLVPLAALRQGVISNLGNPKMAVFFASLLPQFAPGGEATFAGLALLGLIFCTMTFVWLTGYAMAIATAGDFLRRPRVRRTVEGLTGAALVTLGLHIATADD